MIVRVEPSFVDTNILVYAHDKTAGPKHERARELVRHLWTTRSGVVSTQVLQELYVTLRRKVRPPLLPAKAREIVDDYRGWRIVVNDDASVIEASEVEERFQISFWDALIVHAATRSGVTTIYSEDLNDGQDYGNVRVINPFTN